MCQKLKIAFLLGFFGAGFLQAQNYPPNQPRYDEQKVHFGFCLGFNYFDFKIDPVENLAGLDGYYSVKSKVEPGYTIGIITNLRLSKHFDLRFIPSFASTVRKLEFDIKDPDTERRTTVEREIESSFIEFPFELKFKSDRIENYRLYVLGGFKYNKDLASDEDIKDDRIFKLQSDDLFYEVGFGIDIYFEYFKFSPQIKASFGFANLRVEDGTFLVDGIKDLTSRSILINFTFE